MRFAETKEGDLHPCIAGRYLTTISQRVRRPVVDLRELSDVGVLVDERVVGNVIGSGMVGWITADSVGLSI